MGTAPPWRPQPSRSSWSSARPLAVARYQQPDPTWRQRHGRKSSHGGAIEETARIAARSRAAARVIGMLINPSYPGAELEMSEVEASARGLGLQIQKVTATNEGEIDAAFATIAKPPRVDALFVGTDGWFIHRRNQFTALAARYAIPTIYPLNDFTAAGGLIATHPTSRMRIASWAFISTRFSKAPNPPTYPSCSRQNSSYSLTSRPPRRSAWKSRRRCSP